MKSANILLAPVLADVRATLSGAGRRLTTTLVHYFEGTVG